MFGLFFNEVILTAFMLATSELLVIIIPTTEE